MQITFSMVYKGKLKTNPEAKTTHVSTLNLTYEGVKLPIYTTCESELKKTIDRLMFKKI